VDAIHFIFQNNSQNVLVLTSEHRLHSETFQTLASA